MGMPSSNNLFDIFIVEHKKTKTAEGFDGFSKSLHANLKNIEEFMKQTGTNLNITRTRSSDTSQSNNNGGYSNSSNVSVTRGTSSSSSNNSGGRRATRRN